MARKRIEPSSGQSHPWGWALAFFRLWSHGSIRIWEGLEVWEALGLGLRAEWDIAPLVGAGDARSSRSVGEKGPRLRKGGQRCKGQALIAGKGGGLCSRYS